jgi:hypothetical protein
MHTVNVKLNYTSPRPWNVAGWDRLKGKSGVMYPDKTRVSVIDCATVCLVEVDHGEGFKQQWWLTQEEFTIV